MAAYTRVSLNLLHRLGELQRTPLAFSGVRQYCKSCLNPRNLKRSDSFQNVWGWRGSGKRPSSSAVPRGSFSISDRWLGARRIRLEVEHVSPGLFSRQTLASYSTRADRNRVKYLMIATYISATIGGLLLIAVGLRFYGRFRKRARGVEEVDSPLFGRRSRVFCRYRGYSIASILVDTVVNDIPRFEVRPDDIWVISFPKAGEIKKIINEV